MSSTSTRRKVSLSLVLACIFGTPGIADVANRPPNIVLCMGDDHGWDETAYNGHPHLQTPVLDEMAATGLRFDRFYSASPVCSPTRGSVITGRHPNRYGTFAPNWSIRPEEIGIAHILSQAGYACAHFGKWHLGPVKADSPTNPGAMGFQQWLSHDNFFEMNPFLSRHGAAPEQIQGESSEILIDETVRFIRQSKQNDQPFFAVVWFGSPHEPYSGLEQDLALYDNLPAKYPNHRVKLTSMNTGLPTERPLGEVLRERYAEITAMDRALGQLRDFLTAEGLRHDTLLWYCGDNGIPASARKTASLRGRKGQVYEGGIRVPGIMEWPAGIPQPRVTDVNAVTSDMLPTICELVGQPVPNRPLDGISLKPLIDGNMTIRPTPICFWNYDTRHETKIERPTYIDPTLQQGTTPLAKKAGNRWTRNFTNYRHPQITDDDYRGPRAIMDHRFKLIVDDRSNGDAVIQLFDLREDFSEKDNQIAAHPKIAEDMQQQLRAWQQSVLNSLTGADYR